MYELIKIFANYVLNELNPTEFNRNTNYGKWWHFNQSQLEEIVGKKMEPEDCELIIRDCIPYILDNLPGYKAVSDVWFDNNIQEQIYGLEIDDIKLFDEYIDDTWSTIEKANKQKKLQDSQKQAKNEH